MAPVDASALAQIEDHGARLRELEGNHADFSAQLATTSVELRQLTRTVENGMDAIGLKFDAFTASTQTEMSRQGTIVDALDAIEKGRLARSARRGAALRTFIQPLMIAAAGVGVKELFALVWRHFHGA
jgi:hypothetical protein